MSISTIRGSAIEIDFNEIKGSLKEFLQNQSEFTDHDFNSSGLSILLDVLAYNTQMNAMIGHLTTNELFLPTVQTRSNGVIAAQQLGYVPASKTAARAVLNVTITPTILHTAQSATIPNGTIFSAGGYKWYTLNSYSATKTAGKFIFQDVNVYQGTRKTIRYYYDSTKSYPKFEIPDSDIDTTTLSVKVKDSESVDTYNVYNRFNTFNEITDSSFVYFIQENALGRYEVYFTNGTIGQSPSNGNIIELSYIYTDGPSGNGVSIFTLPSTIVDNGESRTVLALSRSSGGSEKETLESIKFNAPLKFMAQNRCVTANDYVAIIRNMYPGIQSITAWGGEYNTPPEFGKIFISIKPINGDSLSYEQKEYIINSIIKPRSVATITPSIINPEITYIGIECDFKYDSNATPNQVETIESMVKDTILDYNDTNLNVFDGIFKHSKLLSLVDSTEASIQNSTIRVQMLKKFIPSTITGNQFIFNLPGDIDSYDPDNAFISSTMMLCLGKECYFTDSQDADILTQRNIHLVDGYGTIIIQDVGQIDLTARKIYLYGFTAGSASQVILYFNPNSLDIAPNQNQILQIAETDINVTASVDTIKVYGAGGALSYITSPFRM